MFRQHVDILLQDADAWFASLDEPPAQCLEGPDVADAGLFLENRMNLGDDFEGFRRVERCTARKFDQHIDRIGAGELGVETVACGNRLLLVRHLIGEPVPRLKASIDEAKPGDDKEAGQTVKPGTADHAGGDKAAKSPQLRRLRNPSGRSWAANARLVAQQ